VTPGSKGVVIDRVGKEVRRVGLGSYLEDVFVDADGSLWLSYADQGFGKPLPDGGGITHIGPREEILYALNRDSAARATCMSCYAMTLNADGSLWASIHPDFPIIRIDRSHRVTAFQPVAIRGAHAVAVRGTSALLVGTYEDASAVSLIDVRTPGFEPVVVVTTDGREIIPKQAMGSDGILYVREDDTLYAVRVPDRSR
jgi:hypothetical protein